jgi:hypothetical protein
MKQAGFKVANSASMFMLTDHLNRFWKKKTHGHLLVHEKRTESESLLAQIQMWICELCSSEAEKSLEFEFDFSSNWKVASEWNQRKEKKSLETAQSKGDRESKAARFHSKSR